MTEAQRRVYNFICRYWNSHGSAPSIREMSRGLGYASTNAARCHLDALVKAGKLEVHENPVGRYWVPANRPRMPQ